MIQTKAPQAARERLLNTANRLFYAQGIQATGVDQVVAEAGVAKATLYNNFPGKDGLIAAYLERRLVAWVASVREVDVPSLSAAERVDRLFALLEQGMRSRDFRGCPFTNAVIECPDVEEIHEVVKQYRTAMTDHFATISGLDQDDPRVTRLAMIYDGALVAAKSVQDWKAVEEARRFATEVVGAARFTAAGPRKRR